ncbi:hypothetical protein G4Y79_08640 [Phototrophicus methaneseepsis]|uniref:DUF304 domain-containing protein n=1 Tax=Phototrophicus methaneseepsis TaxID=2710758 RepID=A0A7S8ECG0_9CHLR|nr:hypothetical protein [Phototrophicus methaneseepsis]QPC84425.1 hypothetical protein G4Y79_08640 [Phototrophicus methaneseepsis]
MKLDHIPPELRNKVEMELFEDEDLLWIGQPQPLSAAIGPTWLSDLLPIGMVGIFLFFFFSVVNGPMGGFDDMPSFFYFVPLFILATTIWPFISRLITATRSTYALTDRRALIIDGNNVKSYGADDIEFIQRNMRGQDSGDIVFAKEISTYRSNNRTRIKSTPIGFLGIDNVRAVEAMMLRTFNQDETPRKRKHQPEEDDFLQDSEVAYYEDRQS